MVTGREMQEKAFGFSRKGNDAVIRSISFGLHARRVALRDIQKQLTKLNVRFPGERHKKVAEQDPEFRRMREDLSRQRDLLAPKQTQERGRLKFVQKAHDSQRRGW